MSKKMIENAILIAVVLSILALGAYTIYRVNTPSTYHVVKSGNCYTFKSTSGYISSECHATYAGAEASMQSLIDFQAKERAYEERDWKTVTE